MSHSARHLALLFGAGLMTAACTTGTSLLLEVDPRQVAVEQLQVQGTVDGELVFGPAVRPERRGEILAGMQTVRILLPDERGGETVRVRVSGLLDARLVAAADALVIIERNAEVKVPLALSPAEPACTGCSGCCDGNNRCLKGSVAACGAGGVACFPCDEALADRCDGAGRCACGDGPSCSPIAGTDRCVDGECRCGDGGACPPGTECANGVCRCTAASCAGCCNDNVCEPGTKATACGGGGLACMTCAVSQVCEGSTCINR